MKLRYSATSPYVRKVMVTAIEIGLNDKIDLDPTNVWDPESDISAHNPLGKVPTLVTDGGEILFDSPVICEFLDSLHDGQALFPPAGGQRWSALRLQALGDGLMDASILRLLEAKRPPDEKSDAWIGRQKVVMERSLDEIEEDLDTLSGEITIGQISIGCALGYLDLRFAEDNWRGRCPALADWYEEFSQRRSMTETEPKDAG